MIKSAQVFLLGVILLANAVFGDDIMREQWLLSGTPWQFVGAGPNSTLSRIDSREFTSSRWQTVTVPHVFQTRNQFNNFTQGWYRRNFTVPPKLSDKRLYLVFEGAATIADVYVNGKYLGQHRGAYTRFVFDATDAIKSTGDNELAVYVNNNPVDTKDCLPNKSGLYTVWGGLYRKVWLVATDPLHIDLQDYASPGVYITPQNISAASADLSLKILARNSSATSQTAEIRATLLDPGGAAMKVFSEGKNIPAGTCTTIEFAGNIANPKLWAPGSPNLYHIKVEVLHDGQVVDEVTQPTGFRNLVFEKATGRVKLNGKPIILVGANLHQENES